MTKSSCLDANAAAKTEYEKAMEEYYAENPDKKPVEKVKKEKEQEVVQEEEGISGRH